MLDSTIDKVDATMADIQEQTQLANEVSEAISAPQYAGVEIDDVRSNLSVSHKQNRSYFTIGRAQAGTGRPGAGRAERPTRGGRARTNTSSRRHEQSRREYVSPLLLPSDLYPNTNI